MEKARSGRLRFVDGLRGVAAMMVVGYHFWGNLPDASRAATPAPIAWLLERGNLGVDVFFVLSGFVIAHSLRGANLSLSYAGRFAVRRSVRLDPPFWLVIALEVVLVRVGLAVFPDLGTPVAGWKDVLANAAYAYRFTGNQEVLPVFWSLTYEVQFYMVLVLAAIALSRIARWPNSQALAATVFVGAFLYSLLIWLSILPLPMAGLFIDRWFQFALGVAAWLIAVDRRPIPPFAAAVGVALVLSVWLSPSEYRLTATATACLTAGSLALAGRYGKMDWLAGPVVQFLGRISYSLYLLHLPIGWRTMSLLERILGPDMSAPAGYASFTLGVAVSILAAWILYVALEGPSIRLARKVTLPRVTASR